MTLSIPSFLENMGPDKMMQTIGIIIPIWAIFMIILERVRPYTTHVKLFRRGFWMDLVWYTIIQSKIMEMIIFGSIILPLKIKLGLGDSGILSHWNFGLLIFFFFVTHDFYIYWFHRFQHNNKWLWRTHEGHHSVREVDFLAGSRSHFLEILINQTIEFLPIFFLLDAKTAAFVYPIKAMIDALWGMWIHANVNVNSGKLQYVINGPEMHQWHHANHEEVFYKNYSTKLAIWDWIFGTGFLPNLKPLSFYTSKPKMFGLPYTYPKDFFLQTIYAIFRFPYQKIENSAWYSGIMNLRTTLISEGLSIFGVEKSWTKKEIFDTENARYEMDAHTPSCPTCGYTMKYFQRADTLVTVCEHCNSDTQNLEKFN